MPGWLNRRTRRTTKLGLVQLSAFGPSSAACVYSIQRGRGLPHAREVECGFASRQLVGKLNSVNMKDIQQIPGAVDRSQLRVMSHSEAEQEDREYWLSRSPQERLRRVEFPRELNYGSEVLNQRLQRVLAVSERPRG